VPRTESYEAERSNSIRDATNSWTIYSVCVFW